MREAPGMCKNFFDGFLGGGRKMGVSWVFKECMKLEIVDGDLIDQEVEVIVNAWNRNVIPWWLLLPQGVSGAIKRRAGLEPFRELGRMGAIPLGGAVITGSGVIGLSGDHSCGGNQFVLAVIGVVGAGVGAECDTAREREGFSVDCVSTDWGWIGRREGGARTGPGGGGVFQDCV
jgi:hypothetical protein